MRHVDYLAVAEKALQQIKKGAFLTVQAGDALNVMTIGWATVGFLWGRPMMSVMVRKTRHTFSIIEKCSEFTVSVPNGDYEAALSICGTKSGKNVDKFRACNLELNPGQKVKTPSLLIPGLHFECAIVYKSALDPKHLISVYSHLYPEKDYHTMYFGEIKYSFEA